MTPRPEVSVAVITYNMSEYLQQLLDSIISQRVSFLYEVIIDDDCSSDDTRKILKDYQKKYPNIIKLSLRNENVGGSRNMYGVLQQCKGKYIAILEGDDYWDDENKLQYQYDFMEKHPEYIGMYCNSWVEKAKNSLSGKKRRKMNEARVFSFKDFMNLNFYDRLPNSTDTAFFRNIFRLFPSEDFSVFYKAHHMVWDQSLALILYGKGNIYVDPRVVSHHRSIIEKGGKNYQSKYAFGNHNESDAYMYCCHELYIEKHLHRTCWKFYRVRAYVFAEAVKRALTSGNPRNRKIVKRIWKQRANKIPLIYGCAGFCVDHIQRNYIDKIAGRAKQISKQYSEDKSFSADLANTRLKRTIFRKIAPKTSEKYNQKKDRIIYNKIYDLYQDVFRTYGSNINKGVFNENVPIWICWWTGFETAPDLVKQCIRSIYKHAKNHPVNLITEKNYSEYLDVPSYIIDKVKCGKMCIANFTDYLRVSLIEKYGGLWLDTTLFISQPLPEYMFSMPVFTCKSDGASGIFANGRWTAYCIGGWKGNTFFELARRCFERYWETNETSIDYLLVDYTFGVIYDKIPDCKSMIDSIPITNLKRNDLSHAMVKGRPAKAFEEYIADDTVLYKLSWREKYPMLTSSGEETVFLHFLAMEV